MPTRPAKYSDLAPAAKLLAKAFRNEYLFASYMHPRLEQFPTGLEIYMLHRIREAYVHGPEDRMFVAYETAQDGLERITGLSHWHRDTAKPKPKTFYHRALGLGVQAYNSLELLLYPNPAADYSRRNILANTGPFVQHHWTGTRAEVWSLVLLGVDPAAGGKGIGQELVNWGFDQARQEGVGLSVISSVDKEGFYKKCGFDVVVGTVRDEGGQANPMVREGIPGGTILFWDNGRDLNGVKKYGET